MEIQQYLDATEQGNQTTMGQDTDDKTEKRDKGGRYTDGQTGNYNETFQSSLSKRA